MRRITTTLLQSLIALLGIAALAFLLWEPHLEGRNAQASWTEIYFGDPFLAFIYAASTAFFVGLHRTFRVLGLVRRERTLSVEAAKDYRTIRNCALLLVASGASGGILILESGDPEDTPAGLFLSLIVALPSIVVAVTAGTLDHQCHGHGSSEA
jgi:uncharacterized membrane protein